jgi:hypothetical protein
MLTVVLTLEREDLDPATMLHTYNLLKHKSITELLKGTLTLIYIIGQYVVNVVMNSIPLSLFVVLQLC